MIKDGLGGKMTLTGIRFEHKSDFLKLLTKIPNYTVIKVLIGKDIYFKQQKVASCYRKHELYNFLEKKKINWKEFISSKLLPDDAIFVIKDNTMFILEIKYQEVSGSTDEKLQTCDFKRKQFLKLFSSLNIEVEYIYILNSWFKQSRYKDVLNYIISVNCRFYFDFLPLKKIGLPI